MARNKIIQPGETIGLQLDADERQAIVALRLARPETRDRIRQTPESQEIRLTFDQWDELAGRIDGEAHLTDDRELDRLARKIDRLIEAYFVGEAEPDVGSPSPGWPRRPLESRAASEPSGLPRCRRRGGKQEIGLKLTEHQRRVILDNVPLPKRMRERLAALPGGQQVVELSLKDLDDLQSRMGRAIEDAKYPPKKTLLVALKRIARVRAEQRVEEVPSGKGSWTDVAAQHPPSHGRSGGLAAGSSTETAHGVIIPLSASERRLILEATDLERAVAERLRELDGQEGGVRLTISQLVKLAIATSGVPTRPTSEMDRKKLDRLSGRIHDVVASCLMAERPRRRRVTSPDLPPEGKDDKR